MIESALIFSAALILVYMSSLFLVAISLRDNSIADIGWGAGFALIAAASLFLGVRGPIQLVTTTLVVVWGARLAFHIFKRNHGRGEDWRYAQWRKDWGKWFLVRSYLQVFLLQGLLMLAVTSGVVIINSSEAALVAAWAAILGVGIWVFGFVFESVGDSQLKAFLAQPKNKGKIMQTGLWRYTRHPNYFGEVTQWWGIAILGCSLGFNVWLFISPVTITVLILFVSGIPLLEQKYVGNQAFEDYKRRTSIFIPWFPGKRATS